MTVGLAQLQMSAPQRVKPIDQHGVNPAVLTALAPDQDEEMPSAADLHG